MFWLFWQVVGLLIAGFVTVLLISLVLNVGHSAVKLAKSHEPVPILGTKESNDLTILAFGLPLLCCLGLLAIVGVAMLF